MALLSKSDILSADDRPTEDVHVPEWGGEVRLRGTSVREWERYQKSCVDFDGNGKAKPRLQDIRIKLLVLCAIDENGNRLFTEADLNDLSKKSAKPVDRLYDRAIKLCGPRNDDVEQAAADFTETENGSSDTE